MLVVVPSGRESRLPPVRPCCVDRFMGKVLRRVSDPRFDIPSSLALHDDLLYVINGRFTTEATPETSYTSVAIPRPR